MCLQLQYSSNLRIDKDSPIVFNETIINLDSDIIYDYSDGYFSINTEGIYFVKWWFCGSINSKDSCLSVKIKSCKGHNIESSIINNSGQLYGDALLEVDGSHLCFALFNNCNLPITPYPHMNIKGNISIYRILNFKKHIVGNCSHTISLN